MTADPIASLLLAGVAWLEGVRRVPPSGRLLRQRGRRWELARPTWLVGGFSIATWCAALAPALALPGSDATPARDARRDAMLLRARRWRVRMPLAAARVVGALLLAVLVLGIPMATARWREWGLAGALAAALGLSTIASALVLVALRRLDVRWGEALRAALPLAWPFSALRAAETVLAHATRGLADAVVMRELLGDAALLAAGRAALYDARHGRPHEHGALVSHAELAAAFGPSVLEEFLDEPPAAWEPGASAYCPRCAAVYVASAARCADCRGVALRRGAGRDVAVEASAVAGVAAAR